MIIETKIYHQTLANYFLGKPLFTNSDNHKNINNRKLIEQPWQQMKGGMWPELIETLVDLDFFLLIGSPDPNLLVKYWNQVLVLSAKDQLSGKIDILNLYQQAWSNTNNEVAYRAWGTLGYFFQMTGKIEDAEYCLKKEADFLKVNPAFDDTFNETLIANLNVGGLLLLDKQQYNEALQVFEEAMTYFEKSTQVTKIKGTVSMNIARCYRNLGMFTESGHFLNIARQAFEESTGDHSPESATVIQALGNLAMVEKNYDSAYNFHCEAYEIRKSFLGHNHPDTARSLYNMANAEAGLFRIYDAIENVQKSIEIFGAFGNNLLPDFKQAQMFLDHLLQKAKNAAKQTSGYGLVLLIYNPSDDSDSFFTKEASENRICQSISGIQKIFLDDMVKHGNGIPVSIIYFPGFEKISDHSFKKQINEILPDSLLRYVNIPYLPPPDDPHNSESLAEIASIRRQILQWITEFNLNIVMVRPLYNVQATIDRPLLKQIENSNDALLFEEVDFVEDSGLLVGLYTSDNTPIPAIMPTIDWKGKYIPVKADGRATGTFYLNVKLIRELFSNFATGNMNHPLEQWSMNSFISIASSSTDQQIDAFEKSFSDLVLILKTGSIKCPQERGKQGF